jgi:hypothetical protein
MSWYKIVEMNNEVKDEIYRKEKSLFPSESLSVRYNFTGSIIKE